jgi:hypothetical protein
MDCGRCCCASSTPNSARAPFSSRASCSCLKRHGYDARKPSETLYAVGFAALFEWLNDACPRCRSTKPRTARVSPCPSCRPVEREKVTARFTTAEIEVKGQLYTRPIAMQSPDPGCPKCRGMGRVFAEDKQRGGMRCVTCQNTGRQRFRLKQRWQLVSEFLGDIQEGRRERRVGIPLDTFRDRWATNYNRLLDYLQRCDRTLAAGLDLHQDAVENRSTDPERFDLIEETAEDEPGERQIAPGLDPEPTA